MKTTMTMLLLSLLLPAMSAATPRTQEVSVPEKVTETAGGSADDAQLSKAVQTAISGYEPLSAKKDLLRLSDKYGKEAVASALLHLAKEPTTPGLLQLRAVEALGYVPTEAGRSYLHQTLRELGQENDGRAIAVAAVLRALGGFGAAEVSRVAPYLDHAGAGVREAAASALKQSGAPQKSVLPLLEHRMHIETDRTVKEHLRTTAESLQKQP